MEERAKAVQYPGALMRGGHERKQASVSMLIWKHKKAGSVQDQRRSKQAKTLGTILTVHMYTVHVKLKCLFT